MTNFVVKCVQLQFALELIQLLQISLNKKGQVYSETLNNWKLIAGETLFKVCYPKSFKNSNKFGVSTLLVMVKRGHEVELEYSKKEIMDRMNNFFGKTVVEKIKFTSFEEDQKISTGVSKVLKIM